MHEYIIQVDFYTVMKLCENFILYRTMNVYLNNERKSGHDVSKET